MRRKRLEMLLSKVKPFSRPKVELEEYMLDCRSAAEMLYIAEFFHHDIRGKVVADLGCGTGILSIGAALLGADFVVGVDIDKSAIRIARENSAGLGADVQLVVGDIACMKGPVDVALTNPPFGTRRRGADVAFLEKAVEIASVVYSLHKRAKGSREFLTRSIKSFGGKVDAIYELRIALPPTYEFHHKRRYEVDADLYRIVKGG